METLSRMLECRLAAQGDHGTLVVANDANSGVVEANHFSDVSVIDCLSRNRISVRDL